MRVMAARVHLARVPALEVSFDLLLQSEQTTIWCSKHCRISGW